MNFRSATTITVAAVVSWSLVVLPRNCRAQSDHWDEDLRTDLNRMADRLTATLKPWDVPAKTFRVEDYGAVADGQTLNTAAVARAVDACATAGGGVVLFGKGDYVTGSFQLKSGVMLEVAAGAKILGSTDPADYVRNGPSPREGLGGNPTARALVVAEDCERIGIRGGGEIDGRGQRKNFPEKTGDNKEGKARPKLLYIADCRRVVVDGITLRNSAFWMQHYLNCDDLILQNVTVENQANHNNDGIDIDGCRNVIVRHCRVNSEDDGMCFKGTDRWPMENVLVEDSKFYSTCNAIKYGTNSAAAFHNVLVRNVEAGGPAKEWATFQHRPAEGGIAWESVDGANVENVLATNIHIVRTTAPLFLRLGDRGSVPASMAKPKPGSLRHVVFENISGEAFGPSIFAGIPGSIIEDVIVRNMTITRADDQQGKAKAAPSGAIPERKGDYPNPPMFGRVPADGFWLRHVKGVQFVNVSVAPSAVESHRAFVLDRDTEKVTVDGKPVQ